MQTQNPYDAPKAQVADARDDAVGEIKLFSADGRIGRLRYLAYTTGLWIVVVLALGALGMLAGSLGATAVSIGMSAGYIALLVLVVLLTIQRSHDFNASGWLALLLLVPLANLIFLFIPGTDGGNRFGPRPPPNTLAVKILGVIVPALFVIGIVAAIALPAYQQYVERARTQQSR